MYKLKYYSLSKEEKEKLKIDYYNTELGKKMKGIFNRLLIIGTIGVLFTIYLYFDAQNIWNYVYATILLIASIVFIYYSFNGRIKKLNNYLVSKNKK